MIPSLRQKFPLRSARLPLRLENLEDRTVPAFTATLVGPTATFVGDAAGDTLAFSLSGALLQHNRFTAGDPGFNSNLDFDTTVAGDQTLAAAGAVVNVGAGDGDDTISLADGVALNGVVDGGGGTDTLDYSAYTSVVNANLGLGTLGLAATLDSDQEVPPTASPATGTATVTNYNPVTRTFDIAVTVADLNPATVTGFHIHRAPFGENGPVIVDLQALGTLTPSGTGFTFAAAGVPLPAAHEAAFLGGLTYVNVHTAEFPDGATRGQLFSTGNVNLPTGTATGTASVVNLENVTGGSGSLTVGAAAFGDSLVGSFAVNALSGGLGNDVLVGAPGNDTLNGDVGDDVMVWSNGDNTDVMNGGAGTDRVQVNGAVAAGDVFTVAPGAGGRVDFDRTNLVPFSLDIGTVERLATLGVGGDDTFTVGNLAGVADLVAVLLAGLEGSDTFNVSPQGVVQVTVQGGPPDAAPGDTLTVTGLAGTTNPRLVGVTAGPGASRSGSWVFDGGTQSIAFAGIETIPGTADLSVVKTTGTTPVFPGETVTYTIVVANTGPNPVAGVVLTDTFPGLTGVTFTATGAGGATGFTASGSGPLAETLTLPAGSSVTYTATGTVSGTSGGTLSNTATLAVPAGVIEPNTANNTSTATVSIASSEALLGEPNFAAGPDVGGGPTVVYYNPDGTAKFSLTAFDPAFTGGVRVAVGDFTGDGVPDLAVGTGPGVSTLVRVFDGASKAEIFSVVPFEASFTGGVYVAAGDLNGDGRADLVITPDEGGGPRVRIFSGAGFGQLADFFGIEDLAFRGGARAAVGDVSGDGRGDLLVAAGFGGGPRIAVFDGATLFEPLSGPNDLPPKLFGDFFVFENTLRNGVFIASGDLDGDGFAEVIAGGGPGGGPRVFALSGEDLMVGTQVQVANFFAGDVDNRGGIRLVAKNLDGDNRADLVVGDGTGAGSRVTGYHGKNIPTDGTPPVAFAFDAFADFTGGVFVG